VAKTQKTRTRNAEPRSLDHLKFDPQNARRHPERNLQMIQESLTAVGAARSIVIDERGVILAGNAVVQAAGQAGINRLRVVDADGRTVIAVRRFGLTPEQKTRLALFDNRTAELAEWDEDMLRALQAGGLSLEDFWRPDELADLLGEEPILGLTDPDSVPEPRATAIQPGDLFELGAHRLLCGDSTAPGDVARLLGNVKPVLMVTDPPYGVKYDPHWRVEAGLNRNTKKLGKVTNDERADWTDAWRLFPGTVAYVWHGGLKANTVQDSLESVGFTMRAQIIWAKDRMALSRGDYHWQHEPCWYGVREGASGQRTDDRSQTTLWRIPEGMSTVWEIPAREDDGHTHGTQKPVECMARPMRNHHLAPAVYDPFLGSGTSVIAAEMAMRRCYGLEIEPQYVQVVIDRWEAFTGQTAIKVAGAM
jgi:DNA modification methylase